MPNTLGHLGVQGLVTRALIRDADIKWICAGAVLPDLPWILQRVVSPLAPSERLLDLRLYFLVQGSLAFCLLLSAGIAWCSREPGRVFKILGLNVVIHLLLDSTQIRWAEGVFLLAPLSFEPIRFGLFWPESVVTIAISALGLVFVAVAWRACPGSPIALAPRSARAAAIGGALLLCYFLLPPLFVAEAERSGVGYLALLRAGADREGREVGFDRARYSERGGVGEVESMTGERFEVRGGTEVGDGRVSLQGRFTDARTIQLRQLHRHWPWFRDAATYSGLLIIGCVWIGDRWRRRRSHPRGETGATS